MPRHLRIATFAPMGLALCVLAGCGSNETRQVKPPPPQQPPSGAAAAARADSLSMQSMGQFRASINTAQQQIDATLASLAALTDPAQQDLPGAYKKYSDNVARLQQQAEGIRKTSEAMRDTREAYFASWEDKSSAIESPTIRASAESRHRRLRDTQEQIALASSETKDAYVPFMKDLQDIKTYLATDLSKSKVADLGQANKNVQADGANVKAKLGEVARLIDTVQTPPATVPAAPPTTGPATRPAV